MFFIIYINLLPMKNSSDYCIYVNVYCVCTCVRVTNKNLRDPKGDFSVYI